MSTLTDLRPGDIMFGPIGGFVPGVIPVGAGQFLLADGKARLTWRTWWKFRHVAVVTQGMAPNGSHGPWIVQAMPSGAEEIEIGQEHWTADYIYLRPAYEGTPTSGPYATTLQGDAVAKAARRYIGTPYSFVDYAAIAARHFGIRNAAVRKRITDSGRMICSQLADQAMADAGWHNFDDGRLPQDVTPADLFRRLLEIHDTKVIRPGIS